MNALHRARDGKEWTRLPAAGRTTEPPDWPVEVSEPSVAELHLWNRLWTMPQALVWEADRCADLVAFYVRTYLEAMKPGAGAQARTFVKQLSTELLLTPQALLSARYVIEGSADDQALTASVSRHPAGSGRGHQGRPPSARDRFTVVPTGPVTGDPEDEDDESDEEQRPETDVADELREREEPPF
jgi:hypothetical protein